MTNDVFLVSGIDHFIGRAYQFYSAYKHDVSLWDKFTKLLREEFQSADYNEKLFE